MIRKLGPSDRDKALPLVLEFYRHHAHATSSSHQPSPKECMEAYSQWISGDLAYGLEDNGRFVGIIRFRKDGNTYWVEDLVVAQENRRQGIGSILLGWAEEWVRERGAKSLFLDVVPSNQGALDFFRSHGYIYLNTVELRKDFAGTPQGTEVTLFDRKFLVRGQPPR